MSAKASHPVPGDEPVFERIIDEYLKHARLGDAPDLEVLAEKYPQHADEIRSLLPTIQLIDRARGLAQPPGEELPPVLGDFQVIREIGRGGMGVVYEARQVSLGRRVALKVLGPHRLLAGEKRERFEREARTVASLEHPNIVPVYSVGEAHGVPYMAMQFIEGKTLVDVIAAEKTGAYQWTSGSSTGDGSSGSQTSIHTSRSQQIARIGRDVAGGLAVAHAAGVLHRDIKPGNLILDPSGKVWITDFGLAKVEQSQDLTRSGHLVGTPRYMAPESIQGWADPRTDVYGVGVTLYETLTGEAPFSGGSRVELLRNIEEREPPRPRRLDPRIPRDLETIVLTAMDRVPERRYPCARALADDLDRYLQGQPIEARGAAVSYRIGLFLQRHSMATTATALTLLLLVAMAVGWSVSLNTERRDALHSKSLAERNSQRAVDAVDRLLTRVADERLLEEPGFSELRRDLLEDAVAFYLKFLSEQSDDPELREGTIRAWLRLGRAQNALGQTEEAERSARKAIRLTENRLSDPGRRHRGTELRALAFLQLGFTLRLAGNYKDAAAATRRATDLLTGFAALEQDIPAAPRTTFLLLDALLELGKHQMLVRDFEAAEHTIDDCIRRTEAALQVWPDDAGLERNYLHAIHEKALLCFDANEYERCVELGYEARRRYLNRAQEGRLSKSDRADLVLVGKQLAATLLSLDRVDEADDVLSETLGWARELSQDYPRTVSFRAQLGNVFRRYGRLERERGNTEAAIDYLEESLQVLERCRADAPRVILYRRDLAESQRDLGGLKRGIGDLGAAETLYQRALEGYEALAAEAPENLSWSLYLADMHGRLGAIAKRDDNRLEEAEARYRKALEHSQAVVARNRVFENRRRLARALNNLGGILQKRGKLEEASTTLDQSEKALRDLLEEAQDSRYVLTELAIVQRRHALILASREKPADATLRFREVVETRRKLVRLAPGSLGFKHQLGSDLINLGISLSLLERWEDAGEIFEEAVEVSRQAWTASPQRKSFHRDWLYALDRVAYCHLRCERIDEALGWLARATSESPQRFESYELVGISAARFAQHLGPEHAAYDELIGESASSLRVAVDRGTDRSDLAARKALQNLKDHPSFQWLFGGEED